MKIKKNFAVMLAIPLILGISSNIITPKIVYAEEITDTISIDSISSECLDDNKIKGTADTNGTTKFSLDSSQTTYEQEKKYNQLMPSKQSELEIGESMVIGSDEEGVISITCVSSHTSLSRASLQTSKQRYNINKTILGVKTLLATVDLECKWYKNGIDGYIQNLHGTYTEKNSAWLCSWDNYKVALPYNDALWLNIVSLGSSYSIMLTADYNPINETLSFSIGQ